MTVVYVAPAAKVFTMAHASAYPPGHHEQQVTKCGAEMDPLACWLAVELKPGDKVCPACLGEPEDVQGALL